MYENQNQVKNLYIAACAKQGGIYHYRMDGDGNTEFVEKTLLDEPMYMVCSEGKMYILLWDPENKGVSGMITYDIAEDGRLVHPSGTVSTMGKVACHLCVSRGEVYAVNYSSGSVWKYPDGLVVHEGKGIDPKRQEAPHTHCVIPSPDGNYICVTDLGLDTIFFYNRDLQLCFKREVPKGYGARHLVFSEKGDYLYCVNEMHSSVSVFAYDGENTGYLDTYEAAPQQAKVVNTAAAIRIQGNRLYISNRGLDNIVVFEMEGGKLRERNTIPVGNHPRDFHITDELLICCNMQEDSVTFYKMDGYGLQQTDNRISGIERPLCVVIGE